MSSSRGEAILVTKDRQDPVTYGLTLGDRTGWGQLVGEFDALHAAFEAGKSELRFSDGRVAPIILTSHNYGTGLAEFQLAGAVHGGAGV